ncbi:MAG: hypothetical protein ACLQVY_05645 [Limisphaerales bacterium]
MAAAVAVAVADWGADGALAGAEAVQLQGWVAAAACTGTVAAVGVVGAEVGVFISN